MKQRHHLHINRNQFVSMGDVTLEQLQSFQSRKSKQFNTFLTQKTISLEDDIHNNHRELKRCLDNLDQKVAAVIQHNQAVIFNAYKNHFARVKKELQEFKKNSEAQANNSTFFLQKIECLQKQLAIFREESLRMFSKVTEKEKTIEQLKFTLDQLISQKKHMEGVVKQLSKRNREIECQKDREMRRHSQNDHMTLQLNSNSKNFITTRPRDKSTTLNLRPASNMSKAHRSVANHTISIDTSFQQFTETDAIGKSLKQRLPHLEQKAIIGIKEVVLQLIAEEQRKKTRFIRATQIQKQKDRYDQNQTRFTNRSRSIYTADPQAYKRSIDTQEPPKNKQVLKQKTAQFTNNLQLSQYFKKCIDAVRKKIGVRSKVSTISFYKQGAPISIQQFKKIDFIHLMQLVCSHDSVVLALYNSLVENVK